MWALSASSWGSGWAAATSWPNRSFSMPSAMVFHLSDQLDPHDAVRIAFLHVPARVCGGTRLYVQLQSARAVHAELEQRNALLWRILHWCEENRRKRRSAPVVRRLVVHGQRLASMAY